MPRFAKHSRVPVGAPAGKWHIRNRLIRCGRRQPNSPWISQGSHLANLDQTLNSCRFAPKDAKLAKIATHTPAGE